MSKKVDVKDSFSPYCFTRCQNKDIQAQQATSLFSSGIKDLPDQSEGIIFIKQKYEPLFHHPDKGFPGIKSITVNFWAKNDAKPENILISLKIQKTKIIFSPYPTEKNAQNKRTTWHYAKQGQEKYLLPSNFKKAQLLLQKKIWIKISSAINSFEVNIGDLIDVKEYQDQNRQKNYKINLDQNVHPIVGWKNSEQTFKVGSTEGYDQDYDSIMFHIKHFQVIYEIPQYVQETLSNEFAQTQKIQILKIKKIYNSVINNNPSILTRDANRYDMGEQIQTLYNYLENLSITQLPNISQTGNKSFNVKQYEEWRNTRHAIHASVTTPWHIFKKDSQKDKQPIGILNHLIKIKKKDSQKKDSKKQKKIQEDQQGHGGWEPLKMKQSNTQLMHEIYNNRQYYVRIQLTESEGIAPGSNAVLQIWPPYCCSPIHNHGEAYGLIKVLSNQIRVQNFSDLNFIDDKKPFDEQIYQQNSFTWLSEYSFGIHRLVNTTPMTTLSLQSYSSKKDSKQFFQFIKDKGHEYSEYYPQHDWQNYLDRVDQNQAGLSEIDRQFINLVISRNNLRKDNGEIDSSFASFVMVLKREYMYLDAYLPFQY